jgi:DNA (cytosine-5)-methyltransferase 1
MRLLDLCCSAGGAGEGYRRAGFTVTGVDIVKRACGYPAGRFIRADAIEVLRDRDWVRANFDAVHASFPCQTHSITKNLRDAQGKGSGVVDLLPEGMPLLRSLGLPYVSENVPQAVAGGLRPDLLLCGSMFPELHVYDDTGRRWLQRHRIFESNILLSPPRPCDHKGAGVRPLGIYASKGDDIPSGGQTCRTTEQGRSLMGAPWMSWKALTEAIPPAYTEWIGHQLSATVLAGVSG